MNRKLFSGIKSQCRTKEQRLAFNELIKAFADNSIYDHYGNSVKIGDTVVYCVYGGTGNYDSAYRTMMGKVKSYDNTNLEFIIDCNPDYDILGVREVRVPQRQVLGPKSYK